MLPLHPAVADVSYKKMSLSSFLARRAAIVAVALSVAILSTPFAMAIDATTPIERASTSSSGVEGDDGVRDRQSISPDGRYVAFSSYATNIHPDDTDWNDDIFVKDLQTGALQLASTSSSGVKSNNSSFSAGISANGRYVVFNSAADNLIAGDTNGSDDIFVKDLQTGTLTLASTDSSNVLANSYSNNPTITNDGRYVAFVSDASNLVAGDTNGSLDLFVKDLQTGATTRVSTDSSGAETNGPSISDWPIFSANNRYITFTSSASNLVAGDTNSRYDIFVKDLQTGTTTRVSTDSSGTQSNGHSDATPMISEDGRYVVFESRATNLVADDTNAVDDIFMKDIQTGTTTRVSTDASGAQANSMSGSPSISNDGRLVAFHSYATNLTENDTNSTSDIFAKDIQTGEIVRLSSSLAGVQADGQSSVANISGDSRFVAFLSDAENLVPGDTNFSTDVFVRENPLAQVLGGGDGDTDTPTDPSSGGGASTDDASTPTVPDTGFAALKKATPLATIFVALAALTFLIWSRHIAQPSSRSRRR